MRSHDSYLTGQSLVRRSKLPFKRSIRMGWFGSKSLVYKTSRQTIWSIYSGNSDFTQTSSQTAPITRGPPRFDSSRGNLMFSLVKLDWVLYYVLHCWSSCEWDSRTLGSGSTWLLFTVMENTWFCYVINLYHIVFAESCFVQVNF